MLSCLPEFLPDELLYSVITAWADRLPLSHSALLQWAFGETPSRAFLEIPKNLMFFLSQVPPSYDMTIERLINNHTLYPYYSTTLQPDRRQHLWNLMCENNSTNLLSFVGTLNSIVRVPKWLRYCPSCVDEDRKFYGRAYWHRLHQIPGVLLCPTHDLLLEKSNVLYRYQYRNSSYQFSSLNSYQASKARTRIDRSNPNYLPLIRLTECSMYLLRTPGIIFQPEQMRKIYKFILENKGLLIFQRMKDPINLGNVFIEYYTTSFLEQIGCSIDVHSDKNWIRRVINKRYKSIHPLCHLLLITFFGYSLEEIFQLSTEKQYFGPGPWPCCNKFCNHYGQTVIPTHHIEYRAGKIIGTFTCTCGFSYSLSILKNPVFHEDSKYNITTYGPIWTEEFIKLWNDKTVTMDEMSNKLGEPDRALLTYGQHLGLPCPPPGSHISIMPIPTKRRRRLLSPRGIQGVEEDKTSKNRKSVPRSTGTRVHWQERDHRIYLEVKEVLRNLRTIKGKPKRITRSLIYEQLALQYGDKVPHQIAKLPETAKLIAQSIDTNETYALRAIEWAKHESKKTKTRMTITSFLKLASIKHLTTSKGVMEAVKQALEDIE